MNYYPFHVGDYASHTAHLEPMEDLAYRRLLDLYYLRETPLPADIQATAKLVRMRSCAADVESVLREFFELTEDGWRHSRCDAELDAMREKQQKQRDRANKRWQKPAQEPSNAGQQSTGNANAVQQADPVAQKDDAAAREIDAVAMPPTPTPTPTPTPKEKKEESCGSPQSADPPSPPASQASLPIAVAPPPFDGTNAEALNGRAVVPLASGWDLPTPWGEDAEALGFKPPDVIREAERFRQYWVSGKGAGTRRNVKGWRQCWSNWLAKAAERAQR